ncbi:MAG: helix-turn-helix domain-containing protein, partial [Burkholderiales bacterium]
MPNLSSILKSEISRIARRELRDEVATLRKSVSQHRTALATAKKVIADLQRRMRALERKPKVSAVAGEPKDGRKHRYSAQRLAAHRAKIGLSAKDYGRLIGVSGLSIYKWEAGGTRPRQKQLEALATVRGIS